MMMMRIYYFLQKMPKHKLSFISFQNQSVITNDDVFFKYTRVFWRVSIFSVS